MDDDEKNYKRGLECIEHNHGRVLEFVDVELAISGYSARVIREWYTHIGGSPTRLQASTRYIDYGNFEYITPASIQNDPVALEVYDSAMEVIKGCTQTLCALGVPREDAALPLPLGMTTNIVDKRNVRNLIDMSRQRLCGRAYWEYRKLFRDILSALRSYSPEWETLINLTMKPKCELLGYCPEAHSCGHMPKEA